MKPIPSGRYNTTVTLEEFCIHTRKGDLCSLFPFKVDVNYYYEPLWKPLEDDPGAPEYAEVMSAVMLESMDFVGCGYFRHIAKGTDLINFATDEQRDAIADLIITQGKQERYSDPDNYRTAPDERIRRELGWGFNEEYDRDAT